MIATIDDIIIGYQAGKRHEAYPYANLREDANLLVFPNLDSANIALGLLCSRSNGLLVGPFLSGLEKPVHILISRLGARLFIFNRLETAALMLDDWFPTKRRDKR